MQIESKEWFAKKKAVTGRIFLWFVVVSILVLIYFNLTSRSDLVLISQKFPELGDTMQKTFVRSYKMALSAAIFLTDIILVGPFAYIAYFGDHIKPSKRGKLSMISFFDFGLLLAFWFTVALAGAHYQVLAYVRKSPSTFMSPTTMFVVLGLILGIWLIALLLKFYTYTPEQRMELKKYAIRF